MKRRAFGIWLIAILTLLWPVSASQQSGTTRQSDTTTQQTDTNARQGLSSSDRSFIADAAHDGIAEVEFAKMAVQRASSEEVKQFAQRLMDDHSKANSELMQLAASKGISMPADPHHSAAAQTRQTSETQTTGQTTGDRTSTGTTSQGAGDTTVTTNLGKKHQALAQKLSRLSGEEFDREYIRAMVKDHEKAVSMFQREASKGDDSDVKAFAAKHLPTLQEHLRMAREISDRHKNNKSGSGTGNRSGQ